MTSDDNTRRPALTAPYQAIAYIYDKLMEHVEYDRWSDFIASVLRREAKWPPNVLELACGSGITAHNLAHRGLKINAFDKSSAMIDVAREKRGHPYIDFAVASFDDFPQEEKYDAVLCLYDSINYIMTIDAAVEFMKRVKNVLNPGGIFLFDICTRFNSYSNFRGFVDEGEITGFYYFRFSNYDPKTHIHVNDFLLYPSGNPQRQIREHHEQYIFSVRQIQSVIKKAGLRLDKKFDDINLSPAKIRSLRIHFLARKTES